MPGSIAANVERMGSRKPSRAFMVMMDAPDNCWCQATI
jgi:hypothetical protein